MDRWIPGLYGGFYIEKASHKATKWHKLILAKRLFRGLRALGHIRLENTISSPSTFSDAKDQPAGPSISMSLYGD